MNYSTYWSILDTPSKSIQSSIVFLYIAVGAGILWLLTKNFYKDLGDGDGTIVLWGTGTIAILGLAGYILLTFFYVDKSNDKTLEMISSTSTPKVEGIVSNFQRTFRNARYSGETIEKFTVDNVDFAYGNAAIRKFNSFSQTKNNVIFNGQRVRITYSSGSPYGDNYHSILRLEIAK